LIYRSLADLVLVVHLAFVLFVVLGGLLVLRWPKIAWGHVPVAVWGVLIEYTGWICPLTPLENWFRLKGGETGYSGDFIEHYVLRTLYPTGLTRGTQIVLGTLVLVLNVIAYSVLIVKRNRGRRVTG